jgi:hypothetical protein
MEPSRDGSWKTSPRTPPRCGCSVERDSLYIAPFTYLSLFQAALLEKELSGYDAEYHHPTRWSRKPLLASCNPEPPPSTDLIPSAIDLVFHLVTGNEQALENRLARRKDSVSGADFQLFGVSGKRPSIYSTSNDQLVLPEDPAAPHASAAYRVCPVQ